MYSLVSPRGEGVILPEKSGKSVRLASKKVIRKWSFANGNNALKQ